MTGPLATRSLANRSEIYNSYARNHPIEGHMRAAANDNIRGIVAEQRQNFVVRHVVRDAFEGIGGRTMHHDELTSAIERHPERLRQSCDLAKNEITELATNFA